MYIERQVFNKIFKYKDSKKITILIGARQVGKTTILKELYHQLKNIAGCLLLDLDIFSNYEKVSTYDDLLNTLRLNGYKEEGQGIFYLFLDEFQRYADISGVMKNIHDHHDNIKIFASGSSSLAINSRVQESLAGRKRVVNIYPLNFSEFLFFRKKDALIEKIKNLSFVSSVEVNKLLPEAYHELEIFMTYGGYPEVALSEDKEKKEVLSSIFDLYVTKELVDYLKIEKIKHAKTLIQLLAVNNGCETKYSNLAQASGIDEKTVKNYMELLKETFLITIHSPWFANKSKEIVKQPKIYFLDNGVRNFFVNNFNSMAMRNDASFLFEGYVISELIKQGEPMDAIKFWRTKNRYEIDLILDRQGKQTPVEIKYKRKITRSDLKGIKKYTSYYPGASSSFLVNLADNTSIEQTKLLTPFELLKL